MTGRDERVGTRALAAIFLLALVLRVVFVVATNSDALATNGWRWADEGADLAINLLRGNGYVTTYGPCHDFRSFRMPLLPLTLYGIWSVVGYNLLVAKLFMATVSAGLCVLVALLANRFFGPRAGLLAGLAIAVYPVSIYWTGTLGGETLASFFLVLSVLVWTSKHPRRYLLAGLTVGLLLLTRPVFMPFAAALALLALVVEWGEGAWKKAAQFAVVVALLLAPWVVRNWFVHHTLVVTSTEGGITFLESNNPIAFNENAGEQILGFGEYSPEVQEQAKVLPEVPFDRWMYRQGLANIRQEPGAFARSFVNRIGFLWRPFPRLVDGGYTWKHVAVMLTTWTPLFLLAIFGFFARRLWRDKRHYPILIVILWITFVSGVIRGSVRYRAPLEPFFVVYAAGGAMAALSMAGLRRRAGEAQPVEAGGEAL